MKIDSKSLDLAAKTDIRGVVSNLVTMIKEHVGDESLHDGVDIKAELNFEMAGDGTHDVVVQVRLRSPGTREHEAEAKAKAAAEQDTLSKLRVLRDLDVNM